MCVYLYMCLCVCIHPYFFYVLYVYVNRQGLPRELLEGLAIEKQYSEDPLTCRQVDPCRKYTIYYLVLSQYTLLGDGLYKGQLT